MQGSLYACDLYDISYRVNEIKYRKVRKNNFSAHLNMIIFISPWKNWHGFEPKHVLWTGLFTFAHAGSSQEIERRLSSERCFEMFCRSYYINYNIYGPVKLIFFDKKKLTALKRRKILWKKGKINSTKFRWEVWSRRDRKLYFVFQENYKKTQKTPIIDINHLLWYKSFN